MASRASKQTYVGKVIFPATYRNGVNNGKAFITFTLYVDGLAVNPATKKRESGKINCTYTIHDDKDPVPMILCNIFNPKEPESGGLNGQQYKTVMVWLEGSEKLTLVMNQDGSPVPGAVYKNLEYCAVQVLDPAVLALYRAATGQAVEGSEEVEMAAPITMPFQQPNLAPQFAQAPQPQFVQPPMQVPTQTAVQQPAPQLVTTNLVRNTTRQAAPARRQYQPGDRLADASGQVLEFVGGDPTNVVNWRAVQAAPQAAPVQQGVRNTPIRALLDPNNTFDENNPLMQPGKVDL